MAATSATTILDDAHAVFLPAIDERVIPPHIVEHLGAGGTSLLVGESRAEYVARGMSAERCAEETTAWFEQFTSTVRSAAGGQALIAVDQEVGGIQRMHGLVTPLPSREDFVEMSQGEIEGGASRLAEESAALGVNVVLSPIVDIVTGANPWLAGRTVSPDPNVMSRTMSAFVRGLQRSGKVAASAKHFPGHPDIPLDPAVDDKATVEEDQSKVDLTVGVFRKLVAADVRVVMTGPALVPTMDAEHAASTSKTVVNYLRNDVGFEGVVLSDDLDSPGILRGGPIEEAAIQSLNAGVDWLLVAGTTQLPNLVDAVANAAENGQLDSGRLREAAASVRHLTNSLH
jgi:beta-N-acetylhexosaminidase